MVAYPYLCRRDPDHRLLRSDALLPEGRGSAGFAKGQGRWYGDGCVPAGQLPGGAGQVGGEECLQGCYEAVREAGQVGGRQQQASPAGDTRQ